MPLRRLARSLLRSASTLAASVPSFRSGLSVPASSGPYLGAPASGGRGLRGAASAVRRSLRFSTAEGVLAEVVTATAGPTILTGWALHLGAGPATVGLLGALPFLSQAVQLPAAWLTSLFGRRRVAVLAIGLSRHALLPLAALPFLPVDDAVRRALLLAVAGASAVLAVVGNNAWIAWMGELVPEAIRGRYFGRRAALCTVGGTAAGLAAGLLLDHAGARHATGYALSALAVAASIAGAATVRLLRRQHEPTSAAPPRPDLRTSLAPLRDPEARGLLAYQLAWNVAVALGGAYFSLYVLGHLRVGFTLVALHATGVAAVRILTAPLWGRAIDRVGARPVLTVCSAAIALLPLLWIAAAPGRLWPLALDAILSGTAWGGHALAVFAAPLAVGPRRERAFYVGAFSMAAGVAYAVGTVTGGALAEALPGHLSLAGRELDALHAVFALSSLGRLAAAALAPRIFERGAGSVADLARLVRAGALRLPAEARAALPVSSRAAPAPRSPRGAAGRARRARWRPPPRARERSRAR